MPLCAHLCIGDGNADVGVGDAGGSGDRPSAGINASTGSDGVLCPKIDCDVCGDVGLFPVVGQSHGRVYAVGFLVGWNSMMDWIATWYTNQLVLGFLVLARLGSMLAAMPALSSTLPRHLKLLIPAAMTVLVLPSISEVYSSTQFNGFADFFIALILEGCVGFLIGIVIQLLFVGIQVGGELISQASGLQLGESASLGNSVSGSIVSALVGVFVTAMLFASGGHRLIVKVVLESFREIPLGEIGMQRKWIDLLIEDLSQVVIAGFQFAAPVIAILLLTNLLTGLVSRTLPQINLLAVGLSLNALALVAGLSVTIGSAGWLFQSELVRAIEGLSKVW